MKNLMTVSVILCVVVGTAVAHVALTFPPARKYNLDFLDNSRTKAPCGMPKGDIATSLRAGAKIVITWHLAYPHKGGFKLEVLDKNERHLLDLTPTTPESNFVGANDTTAQSYTVHFPQSLSCSGCSIRLLRQAKEWGSNYLFWSCADVDIVPVTEFNTVCSGHGKLVNGLCACNRLNLGNVCQYKDECWSDEDCGSHGKCIDIKATTYPKMQCFCQPGWFGEKCTKKSSVTAPLDLSYYNSKDLSDKYMLYWRILEETEEIEVILQAESTSYVAVGWRPQGITSNCKAFPIIESRRSNLRFLEADVIKIEKVGENNLKEDNDKGKLKPTAEGKPEPSSESTLVSEILQPLTEETSESDLENMRNSREENIIYLTSSSAPATEDSKTAVVGVPLGVGPSDGLERKLFVYNNRFPRQAVLPLQPASGNNSEPRAEPKSKPGTQQDNHGHSETEPGTLGEPEPTNFQDLGQTSTTNASSRRKPLHLYPSPTSYTPKFELHSMDCSDIVIGTVRGNLSRVFDYYTRDRSTPRIDSYYGGSDTLTAAVGFEKDGKTTVLFRKKIKAEELTDHTIENAEMNIIWALGQEPGNYIHRPAIGLETGNAKVKDFYRSDEIKYHGQQRGIATLNFYEERKVKNEVQEPAEKRIEGCAGEWKHPSDCEDDSCEYIARWYFHETKDEIYFWISSSHLDQWTGIGFSKDEDMANSDAVIGWISGDGKVSIFDSWLTGYSHPEYDIKQNTYNATGKLENGLMTLQFIRKRNTGDTDQDISFSDNECLYFLFPVKGGQYNNAFKQISVHEVTPFVSLVCIQSCPVPVLNRNKKPKIEPEPNSEPEPSGEHEPDSKPQEESVVQCMGEWKSPTDCRGYGCDYRAVWEYIDKSDEISFTISTKNHNKWTGIAFSKDRKMEATDAILGWVEENGRFFIMDTWLADYKQPSLDSSQSISNMSGWREDGITTLKFVRKRHTGDLEQDFHFTDTECLYMFFPVHGGVFNAVNKKIRQHESTPKISENKICIKSCTQKQEVILAATASTSTPVPNLTSKVPKIRRPVLRFPTFRTPSTPLQQATTSTISTTPSLPPPPPPTTTTLMTSQSHTSPPVMLVTTLSTPQKMEYIIEVKLPQHGNLNLKEKDSEEYRNLQKQILKDMSVVLTSLDGFEGVEVTELSSVKGDESIIAQMNVIIVDKHLQKKDWESDRSIYHMEELSKTLNETIREGYIGTLLVDPAYLIVQPAGRVQQTSPNEIDTKQGSKNPDFPEEHDTEVYIIIGGIGALVLLIVIQASCMIYRNRRNEPQSHTKEQLINSQWKDYATASSTYSYENFAMREEDRHVSKHPVGSVSNGSAVSRKSAPSHPSANGKSNGRSRHSRPLPPAGHSHTLERISSRHSDGFSNMSGYSSAYATHDRSLRSASSTLRAQQELQPDFYFMPHQRRYSGEVVRVYVDYNNPEYSGK